MDPPKFLNIYIYILLLLVLVLLLLLLLYIYIFFYYSYYWFLLESWFMNAVGGQCGYGRGQQETLATEDS